MFTLPFYRRDSLFCLLRHEDEASLPEEPKSGPGLEARASGEAGHVKDRHGWLRTAAGTAVVAELMLVSGDRAWQPQGGGDDGARGVSTVPHVCDALQGQQQVPEVQE